MEVFMHVKDKVTVIGNNYGKLFTHEKKTDMTAKDGQTPLRSRVEVTASGRVVYRPVRK